MLYLAYGSNLLPQRLKRRIPSAHLVGPVHLPGWSLRFHKRGRDGSAKCDLVPTSASESAHGALYRLHPTQRTRLDQVEGLGNGYELVHLRIRGRGTAFFYRASSAHIDKDLCPFSWYRDLVLAGAEYHRFPAAYIRTIESVATAPDPVVARSRRHLALLHQVRSGRPRRR